ncbi:septation protein IspZ [Suttonella sp. R2A3]|uniref:inner membrane-spanning protein YciB n=1 Tax=Suttonella sp. R2A3 TaxID=2908648 RepID=UPI001F3EAFBF|nr:inner membrane-spanning protein YciB [Suttonella sp. R2A3]UJF24466.1 septation protein IspZ [Suttonella sp. R2A3]
MQDFLPVVAFIGAYVISRLVGYGEEAMYIATVALMVAIVAQIAWLKARSKPIEKRLWLTALVILVLGAITLIFHNPHFVQLKPTILNVVIAAVFLGSQWIGKGNLTKKMLHSAFHMPEHLWTRLNLAWVAFFLIEGAINAWVVFNFSHDFWVGFKFWGLIGLTLIFLIAQFVVLRRYLRSDDDSRASK